MAVEIDSWEDVLEELYEKYKGSGKKMAPEVKLLYLIIASAGAFHFTKSQAAKVPGLDSMLASNPGLVSGLINGKGKKEESQFVSAQELSIQQQKEELKIYRQALRDCINENKDEILNSNKDVMPPIPEWTNIKKISY